MFNWLQVEEGIFQGRQFPPDAFRRALERRADFLDAEKRRKDRDDDDDD